ncbi:SPOR domain-containing protein [Ferrimonas lipolytica]|uniref:SPOR domain-containing protein n=1 Tax=Ferrimonas lipolytica TaxID=2724191 RepID=A0A6H1UEL2_9GAMM|nr:SPOR domain-containing protein [Ferrimonas lipolytica]QIZ77484.1 hypothetical protein HER31_11650 [Ferrimonas lipolytica]
MNRPTQCFSVSMKRALIPVVLLISGCATNVDQDPRLEQLNSQVVQLQQQMSDYKKMEPKLKHLVELEGDLKIVVDELAQMTSELPNIPPPAHTTPNISEPAAPQVAAATPPTPLENTESAVINATPADKLKPKIATAVAPSMAQEATPKTEAVTSPNNPVTIATANAVIDIQLVSFKNERLTVAAWQKIRRKHEQLLGNLDPFIEKATLKQGTFYRLKVGPFDNKNAAIATCNKLRKANQDCNVTTALL